MLIVDAADTTRRRDAVIAYLAEHVDDGDRLRCPSAPACLASLRAGEQLVEGQLSHVGRAYSLIDDGRPLRILVVPKQVGGSKATGGDRGDEHVTVDGRAAQVESAKTGAKPYPRTAHMTGTEAGLSVLLGGDPTTSSPTRLPGDDVHPFDCMAMANSTLCSKADPSGSADGQGTPKMFLRCREHLAATMALLEPTIVLAQGWTKGSMAGAEPSPTATVARALGVAHPPHLEPVLVDSPWGKVAFLGAYHPSRFWSTPSTRGWWPKVHEALLETRRLSLGG